MSRVVITPLLNSLFSRSDRMTKDEANRLVSVLSPIGDDTLKIDLVQSTVAKSQKANYLTIHQGGSNHVGIGTVRTVRESLDTDGWNVLKSHKYDGGSWRIFFLRK